MATVSLARNPDNKQQVNRHDNPPHLGALHQPDKVHLLH